jgi:hypothetical protein
LSQPAFSARARPPPGPATRYRRPLA